LPAVTRFDLRRSGTVLMCSDGLTRHVTDTEIEDHVRRMTSSSQLCIALLNLALERGGHDNITVQLVLVEDLPAGDAAPTLVSGHPGAGKTLDKTIVGEAATQHDGPSPTLIDVPARQRQLTEPGLPEPHGPHEPAPAVAEPPRPSLSQADESAERARRQHRYFLVWGLVILFIGVLLVFWIRSRARHAVDETIPPPEPDPPATQNPAASSPAPPAGSTP
jgi:hypothetical protein